ncbi:MAG: lysophospholipid acyltransferase family protein [Rhodospirillaceae bacterium]
MLLAPLHMVLRRLSGRRYLIPRLFHRILLQLFQITVRCDGAAPHAGAIIVSNHLSYLDIPVIGAHVNHSVFVAKKDVADWPLFGWLARLQDTIFVDRRPSSAQRTLAMLQADWPKSANVIIFPEGTSTNGVSVMPFKSSLFALFSGHAEQLVQPLTLRLENADGLPIEGCSEAAQAALAQQQSAGRDYYAWYGDMELPPHLWAFAKGRGATIRLIFHEPIAASDYPDRKAFAQLCFQHVRGGLGGPVP